MLKTDPFSLQFASHSPTLTFLAGIFRKEERAGWLFIMTNTKNCWCAYLDVYELIHGHMLSCGEAAHADRTRKS